MQTETPRPPGSGIRVLIADDSLVFRKFLEDMLGDCEDIIITGEAKNGIDALAHQFLRGLLEPEAIRNEVLVECPVTHATLVLRRGALEAVGIGVPLFPRDVAFRVNLSCLGDGSRLLGLFRIGSHHGGTNDDEE
mgnify:CR=1 FL=1